MTNGYSKILLVALVVIVILIAVVDAILFYTWLWREGSRERQREKCEAAGAEYEWPRGCFTRPYPDMPEIRKVFRP